MQVGTWSQVCPEVPVERWLDHCCLVFPHASRDYFKCHLEIEQESIQDSILVAGKQVDSKWFIASSVRIIKRNMYVDGSPLQVAGLAEVSTRNNYRKQGWATRLIHTAIHSLQQQGLSVMFLKTRSQEQFYKKLGWNSIERCLVDIPLSRLPPVTLAPHLTLSALNIHDPHTVQEMHRLYSRCAHQWNGPFVRSLSYFQHWIPERHGRLTIQAFGVWQQHELVAYVFVLPQPEMACMEECMMQDPSCGTALLHHLHKWYPQVRMALPVAESMHVSHCATNTLVLHDIMMYHTPVNITSFVFFDTDSF